MNHKTPFGPLHPPEKIEQKRVDAVHRALRGVKPFSQALYGRPY